MVSSTRNPEPPAILRLASALLWIRRRKTTAFIMRARLEWVRKRAVLAKTVSQSALMRLLEVAMANENRFQHRTGRLFISDSEECGRARLSKPGRPGQCSIRR